MWSLDNETRCDYLGASNDILGSAVTALANQSDCCFPVNSKNHIELQYIIKQGWKFGLEDLEQEELSVKLGYMLLLGSGSPVSASIACCVNR